MVIIEERLEWINLYYLPILMHYVPASYVVSIISSLTNAYNIWYRYIVKMYKYFDILQMDTIDTCLEFYVSLRRNLFIISLSHGAVVAAVVH